MDDDWGLVSRAIAQADQVEREFADWDYCRKREQQQQRQRARRLMEQRRESDRQRIDDILQEHARDNPRETMWALAVTIDELRSNFARLSYAIDVVLAGKGSDRIDAVWTAPRKISKHSSATGIC